MTAANDANANANAEKKIAPPDEKHMSREDLVNMLNLLQQMEFLRRGFNSLFISDAAKPDADLQELFEKWAEIDRDLSDMWDREIVRIFRRDFRLDPASAMTVEPKVISPTIEVADIQIMSKLLRHYQQIDVLRVEVNNGLIRRLKDYAGDAHELFEQWTQTQSDLSERSAQEVSRIYSGIKAGKKWN